MQTVTKKQAMLIYEMARKAFSQGHFEAGSQFLAQIGDDAVILPDPPPRKVPVRSGITDDEMYRPRTSPHFRPRF
jgi:hypothetical protein